MTKKKQTTESREPNQPSKKIVTDLKKIEAGVKLILEGIGEDPMRPGIRRTPKRVASMFREILGGLGENPAAHMKIIQDEKHDEMVIIKNIPLYSMCEHHLLPFAEVAHVAYIPKGGRIVGLSKIARVVESFARRLQVQERLTKQVADIIAAHLKPLGVMVVIEAEHMCMSMRGAKKPKSLTVTSAVRGSFRSSPATRAEAINLIKGGFTGAKEV